MTTGHDRSCLEPIPDDVRRQIIDLALDLPELSREAGRTFTDERKVILSREARSSAAEGTYLITAGYV